MTLTTQGGSPVFIRRFRQLLSAALLLCLTAGAVPAQTRRPQARMSAKTASAQPKRAAACSAAWTGLVTYTRTQTQTNNKTVPRVSGRGEDTTDWEMRYNYRARGAGLEAPERNGSSVGRASVEHRLT